MALGSVLAVPMMIYVAGVKSLHLAIGTSLTAVATFCLTTAANYAASGFLDLALAASFIAGGVVGSILGAEAAKRLAAAKGRLITLLAGLIVVVALYMLYCTWTSSTA